MKINNLKPKQKLIDLRKCKLLIHPKAKVAFFVWHKFRAVSSAINFEYLDKFYLPPLRVIDCGSDNLFFANDFSKVYEITNLQNRGEYPCLITPESDSDIQRLAWIEVIGLIKEKNINHPDLFKTLKKNAPDLIVCELMRIKCLTVESYCQFANIKKASFEYQQCKASIRKDGIGLPIDMNWLIKSL